MSGRFEGETAQLGKVTGEAQLFASSLRATRLLDASLGLKCTPSQLYATTSIQFVRLAAIAAVGPLGLAGKHRSRH